MNIYLQVIIQIVFAFLSTIGFAIIINNPKRALLACGVVGAAGWIVYWILYNLQFGRVLSNFTGAFVAGFLGLIFARVKKMPAILFNIPALVPLVPGATAYQAVRTMVIGDMDKAIQLIVIVALVTGAIAMGYMMAQLVNDLIIKLKKTLS
ncbi:membrane protein [Companilactobacillus sp. RD055328]|uniref:threonine/serine exporter family protein n=1 Tax=Companilactobacillus sp. RD055328 TaxID=2916634 RepID=UPI001FC83824|nr:threonine/serine exporter family protein [Companilactobacillus sp. RD055328]GKQ43478.1 membrane protein [Companilactobacillus sp. RD055328]